MSNFGIVCEFNPFHNGHKRIINEARTLGADNVVCAMSGNAVQRGELAIADKYTRAKAAVLCGADLVLELPYPFSAASAEYFARCGVRILSDFCDNIIFGSECGDISVLTEAAEIVCSDDFKKEYRARLDSGEGAASAYFSILGEHGFGELSSNDLLGIEYIKAANELGLDIQFYTVKRNGDAYRESRLGENENTSASAIRAAWRGGNLNTEAYMPPEAYEVFLEAARNGELSSYDEISKAVLMFFRASNGEDFRGIASTDGGIANRICSAAREATGIDELYEKIRTKRYTDAKLRRAVLFCLTGVSEEMLNGTVGYTTLLAANSRGRALLSLARRGNTLRIVTKSASAPRDSAQFAAEERLSDIFTLSQKKPLDAGVAFRKNAFILNKNEVEQ